MIKRNIIFSYRKDQLIEFLPYFQIHKCPSDFPQPPMKYGHHPYFLDFLTEKVEKKVGVTSYSYKHNEKPKYDDFPKSSIPQFVSQQDHDREIQNEILYIINAVCDSYFFTYDFRQSWTTSLDKELRLSYSQEMYIPPDYKDPKEIKPQANYNDVILFTLKNQEGNSEKIVRLNDLLNLYYSTNNKKLKSEYLNACIVFSKAQKLAHLDQSASYIFMVSAIETLAEIEFKAEKPKKCTSCETTQYWVRGKFRDLIDKYGYDVDNKTKKEFYQMRCDISHLGKLFQSSYLRKFFIENQEDFDNLHASSVESLKYQEFMNLTKMCFRTFLYNNMKN